MSDAKAKWQEDIEAATGPLSVVAQLLDARMSDLEITVLTQAQRIEEMEARLSSLENVSVTIKVDSAEDISSIQSRIGVLKFDDLCKRENGSK